MNQQQMAAQEKFLRSLEDAIRQLPGIQFCAITQDPMLATLGRVFDNAGDFRIWLEVFANLVSTPLAQMSVEERDAAELVFGALEMFGRVSCGDADRGTRYPRFQGE